MESKYLLIVLPMLFITLGLVVMSSNSNSQVIVPPPYNYTLINGTNGINGINGINGVNGTNGTNGINGINGINGVNGTNGTNGINGINGINGVNGTVDYIIYIKSGIVYDKNGNTGIIDYSGSNSATAIQYAFNHGKNIMIKAGTYNNDRTLNITSGLRVIGETPITSSTYPANPDNDFKPSGGTILQASTRWSYPAFQNVGEVRNIDISNLVLGNFTYGFYFSNGNDASISFSTIQNVYTRYTNTTIYMQNFQHVRLDRIYGVFIHKLVKLINNSNYIIGGNSLFTDMYGLAYARENGTIWLQGIQLPLNLITFQHVQVNMFASSGVGNGILMIGKDNTAGVNYCSFIDVDIEGNCYAGIMMREYCIKNYFKVHQCVATKAIQLKGYINFSPSNNVFDFVGNIGIIESDSWENTVNVAGTITTITGGVYGTCYFTNGSGNNRPATIVGNKILPNPTGGTATITSLSTSIMVNHGCGFTPTAKDVSVTLTNLPTVPIGDVYCDTFTSTQFTIHCTNAPGIATAIFAWHITRVP